MHITKNTIRMKPRIVPTLTEVTICLLSLPLKPARAFLELSTTRPVPQLSTFFEAFPQNNQ